MLFIPGDCFDCPGGEYCETPGLTSSTSQCSAGYYCDHAADNPSPTDGVTGNVCPQGFYCPPGSSQGLHLSVNTLWLIVVKLFPYY